MCVGVILRSMWVTTVCQVSCMVCLEPLAPTAYGCLACESFMYIAASSMWSSVWGCVRFNLESFKYI